MGSSPIARAVNKIDPRKGLFYVTSEREERSSERDLKGLSISHGAERVRYETRTVPVGKKIPIARAKCQPRSESFGVVVFCSERWNLKDGAGTQDERMRVLVGESGEKVLMSVAN